MSWDTAFALRFSAAFVFSGTAFALRLRRARAFRHCLLRFPTVFASYGTAFDLRIPTVFVP